MTRKRSEKRNEEESERASERGGANANERPTTGEKRNEGAEEEEVNWKTGGEKCLVSLQGAAAACPANSLHHTVRPLGIFGPSQAMGPRVKNCVLCSIHIYSVSTQFLARAQLLTLQFFLPLRLLRELQHE